MKHSVTLVRNFSFAILSLSLLFASCSKNKDVSAPAAAFAGNYQVVDDNETYTLKIENTGGSNFQIREFGGFLNVPLKAVASGNGLTIPSQTFTNSGSGHSITISGSGQLSTKNSKDDTITFTYSLKGFGAHDGSFTGMKK